METRWYKDGSTREVELHVKQKIWKNIKQNFDRFEIESKDTEKRRNRVQYLKETSEKMCQNWENCLKNPRKPLEERKKLREVQKKHEEALHYMSMKKNEEERKTFLEEKRKQMYIRKSFPNHLNMALRFAETYYENEQKMKLNKNIKGNEKRVDKMYADDVKQAAILEMKEKVAYDGRQEDKKKEIASDLLQEIERKKAQKDAEYASRIQEEQRAALKSKHELEEMKSLEENRILEKQEEMMNNYKEYREMQELDFQKAKEEDKRINYVNAIYHEALHRMHNVLKDRHKQDCAVANLRIEPRVKQITDKVTEQYRKEDVLLNKQIKEKTKEEEIKIKSKRELAKKLMMDRQEERRKYCDMEIRKKKEEEEHRQFLLQNRIDAYETFKEYNERCRRQQLNDVQKYRNDLDLQVVEKSVARVKQIQDDIDYRKQKERELLAEDKQFFDYGDEVRYLAKCKNRITYTIDKAIDDYKKNFATVSVLNDNS